MAVLTWDTPGQRFYETGVEKGVLYLPNGSGVYDNGVAWNGLVSVTESPSGAEANAQYADNIKYLNLYSIEEFSATVEAFTYPEEWNQFDGLNVPYTGVYAGQQPRKLFGLSYQTKIGTDLNDDLGYKIHLVYGLKASPSEKAYSTVNDSPEPVTFSWEVNSTPAPYTGFKPVSLMTIDSTKVGSAGLTSLTQALYGTVGTNPKLPTPDEVVAMFAGSVTTVTAAAIATGAPTFNTTTGVATITAVTGVRWILASNSSNSAVNGTTLSPGATSGTTGPTAQIPTSPGGTIVIQAVPTSGAYNFSPLAQTSWTFIRT